MNKSSNCHLCNSLEVGTGCTLPFDEWVPAICISECACCRLLIQALRRLDPDFLLGSCTSQESGPRPGVEVNINVGERCRVFFHEHQEGWGRLRVDVQIFHPAPSTRSIEEFPTIAHAPEISLIPGDPALWKFLRRSLQRCLNEHPLCSEKQDSQWFPDRLLYLSREEQDQYKIRLVETKHHRPKSPYIALSHCWGSKSFICTTEETIKSHMEAISAADLPRTFQDTLTVANELRVSYVWIDSLCIIQNSGRDWAEHAQKMGSIYQNALFVVAAVSSPASSIPFLGPDAPSSRSRFQAAAIIVDAPHMHDNQGETLKVMARVCSGPELSPSWIIGPLEERAWAWQERYCAVRVVNFTHEEVKWNCKSGETCECQGTMQLCGSIPSHTQASKIDKPTLFRAWENIVGQYSERELTYFEDRLPALAGAASQFGTSLQSRYIAGLWDSELPRCLAWYRRDLTDSPSRKPKIFGTLDNGVPSWSWASNRGQCEFLWSLNIGLGLDQDSSLDQTLSMQSEVRINKIQCDPSSENLFGEVQRGSFIELHGRVTEATMKCDDYGRACVQRKRFSPQLVVLDCRTTADQSHGPHDQDRHMCRAFSPQEDDTQGRIYEGTAYCLLLFTATWKESKQACVLILGEDPQRKGTFQRLGLGCGDLPGWAGPLYQGRKTWRLWEGWEELDQWENWNDWFDDAALRTVRIA